MRTNRIFIKIQAKPAAIKWAHTINLITFGNHEARKVLLGAPHHVGMLYREQIKQSDSHCMLQSK